MTVTNGADATSTGPSDDGTDGDSTPSGGAAQLLSAERRKKRDVLAAQGIDPTRTGSSARPRRPSSMSRYADLEPDARTGEVVRIAGRLASIRGHGQLTFATLQDVTGAIQLLMQDGRSSEPATAVLANLDLGDWIGAEGEVVTSRRGRAVGRRHRSRTCSPRRCGRCPTSGTGWPTPTPGTASARSTSWPTPTAGRCSTSASRPSPPCGRRWWTRTSSRSRRPSSSPRRAGRWPARSSPTPMPSTSTSACASRPSCT